MKHTHTAIQLCVLLLLCGLTTLAQTSSSPTKRFEKDWLAFDYPNNWRFEDQSNEEQIQLALSLESTNALIKISALRSLFDTPEKVAEVRTKIVDPYIETMFKLLTDSGGKPSKTTASITIGGAQAEGVRLRAELSDGAGEADVYWLISNNRLVVLTYLGSDKSLKQANADWDTIRNSLKVTVKDK